jgi:acyl-CoA thioesterase-2
VSDKKPNSQVPPAEERSGSALEDLVGLLNLQASDGDMFVGQSPKDRWQRVFGGQVLGQALVAAQRTVDERICHSLHAYFLWPGNPKVPIHYRVERSRDGNSFSSRNVDALQSGRTIFTMSASFQMREAGLQHQSAMPDVPLPEALKSEKEWRAEAAALLPEDVRPWFLRERPIEIRPVLPENRFSGEKLPAKQILWVRAKGPLGEAPAIHQCVLAYASDMSLLDTSLLPHGYTLFNPELQLASLDHAMWFHRPFRADEWLLYVQESPNAAGGRSFNTGAIYARDGRLVASVAQEGLVRRRGAPG